MNPRRGRLPCLIVAASLLLSFPAHANEQVVRRFVQTRIPDAKIVSISKLPYGGLYEVAIRRAGVPSVFYVDGAARLLFLGNVVEAGSDRDLTEERMARLSAIEWSSLPMKSAITIKRGGGRREIAVFSDPNCPYCERFERELVKLDDISIHIFMYPVIRPESVRQVKAVWCSPDRAKAWMELMFNRIEPRAAPDCETPVDDLLALGRRLGATATPTFFLRTGRKHSGAMPMAELAPLLDAAARSR